MTRTLLTLGLHLLLTWFLPPLAILPLPPLIAPILLILTAPPLPIKTLLYRIFQQNLTSLFYYSSLADQSLDRREVVIKRSGEAIGEGKNVKIW